MRFVFGLGMLAWVTACSVVPVAPTQVSQPVGPGNSAGRSPVSFSAVVNRIEPLAEQICRQRVPGVNCDFRIFVDARAGQPANAYQTLSATGRPEIGFTKALIAQAHNNDELAFVMGHEAAHHISGHLTRTRDTALAGAVLGGILATLAGGDASTVDAAQNIGGSVGARTYSKEFELEADRLGTEIAYRSGFDPLDGALFFTRIPDPGDQFLGTHPPNSARIQTVRDAMARLQ